MKYSVVSQEKERTFAVFREVSMQLKATIATQKTNFQSILLFQVTINSIPTRKCHISYKTLDVDEEKKKLTKLFLEVELFLEILAKHQHLTTALEVALCAMQSEWSMESPRVSVNNSISISVSSRRKVKSRKEWKH